MKTHTKEELDAIFEEKLDTAKIFGGTTQWLGLRMRPYSIGAQPKEPSCFLDAELAQHVFSNINDKDNIRHGAIAYSENISKEVLEQYELISLDIEAKAENFVGGFSDDLTVDSLSLDLANIMFKRDFAGKRITFDLFDEWSEFMTTNDISVVKKYVRYHPVFINRHTEPEKYKPFLAVFDTVTAESMADAIVDNYLS